MSVTETSYGAAKTYRVVPRASIGAGGIFGFFEKFYETEDKRFDSILLLGAQLDHLSTNQDVVSSWLWRGFSKKARAISRLFIRQISVTYSIPNFLSLQTEDYTGRNSTVGTIDNGEVDMPHQGSDGVLAELRTITGYDFKEYDVLQETAAGVFTLEEFSGYRVWHHQLMSPLQWTYDYLETLLPLSFYHTSINFGANTKPAWVFWKIEAGVRFQASEKANPRYAKGISVGGTPG